MVCIFIFPLLFIYIFSVDYYATVDMDDFVFIIDNIGGIDVTSPHIFKFAITDKLLSIEFVPKSNQILKTISASITTNIAFQDINKLRRHYPSAIGTIKKLQLNGENKIDSDGLWYFIPNEASK